MLYNNIVNLQYQKPSKNNNLKSKFCIHESHKHGKIWSRLGVTDLSDPSGEFAMPSRPTSR